MTEPITVDVPAKPRPALAPLPSLAPLPKLSDKPPEPAKPAEPAATATGTSGAPAAPTSAAPKLATFGQRFRVWLAPKKRLAVGASALVSLAAGVAVVRTIWPDDEPAAPAPQQVASSTKSTAAAPVTPKPAAPVPETPKPDPERIAPQVVPTGPTAPGLPPVAPVASGNTTRPGAITEPDFSSLTLPDIPLPSTPVVRTAPRIEAPVRSGVVPAAGTEPVAPAIPAVPSAPGMLPVVPTANPMLPALPTSPSSPTLPPIPTTGSTGMTPTVPVVPAVPPAAPASPMVPVIPSTPSSPPAPSLPAIPSGSGNTPPAPMIPMSPTSGSNNTPAPKLPAPPPSIPPVAPKDNGTSGAKPMLPDADALMIPPTPKTPPAPVVGSPVNSTPMKPVVPAVQPDFGPMIPATPMQPMKPSAPAPSVLPAPDFASGTGATPPPKLEFTKPENKPNVTPITAIERTPTTSYDVDLYEPKGGDSYETIAREFYNDARFAAALRAYNRNKSLQGAGPVDVPPLHVVKRYTQNAPAEGVPASRPSQPGEWGSAPGTQPNTNNGGNKTFRIPQGGMSMRAVARLTLGSDQRWNDIYDLNQHLRPDQILPAGTELRLPSDARLP